MGQAHLDSHGVRMQQPFKRGGRLACAKQTNADLLQLNMMNDTHEAEAVDMAVEAKQASRDARARLAQMTDKDHSIKSYMKELRKVLEHADVLLEVLDVRDPLGCRAYAVEEEAQRLGKRIVLILNKIDLVPRSNAQAWLEYLRHEFPTLPFKASTQQQRSNLAQSQNISWKSTGSGDKADAQWAGGAESAGTRAILQLIKNYSRNLNLKTSITVGTIGAPNVGKSSLINSLKRSRVCGVASTPGHTKVVQGIMLDRHVRLLDSPGIVFSDANASPGATAAEITSAAEAAMLRNVLKVESVEDPVEPVQAILNRIEPKYLADVYDIPPITSRDAQDFLLRVAYQKGRLGRGALPDLDATARSVLHDWNTGKIKYHTEPPAKHPDLLRRRSSTQSTRQPGALSSSSDDGSAAILTSFSEPFDLAGLLGEADADVLGGDGAYSPPASESQAQEQQETPTQAMHDEAVADVTDSTLGKRGRLDSDDESDDDDVDDSRAHRRPNAWSLLDVQGNDDDADDDDDDDNGMDLGLHANQAKTLSSAETKSKQGKASIDRPMFSAAEIQDMAPARGKERRKARKLKKRRAGDALVDQIDTLMDFGDAHDQSADEIGADGHSGSADMNDVRGAERVISEPSVDAANAQDVSEEEEL